MDLSTVDPNLIYLALVTSLWIGVTAAYTPGTVVMEVLALAGVAACIAVLAQMPTNWVAVLVLVVGVSGFIVMPFIKEQYAVLSVVGLILQGVGGLFMFSSGPSVSIFVIAISIAIPFAYHHWVLLPLLRRTREYDPGERDSNVIGMVGRVTKDLDPIGAVNVDSESWTATTDTGDHILAGERIIVVERQGLRLVVEKVKAKRTEAQEQKDLS